MLDTCLVRISYYHTEVLRSERLLNEGDEVNELLGRLYVHSKYICTGCFAHETGHDRGLRKLVVIAPLDAMLSWL